MDRRRHRSRPHAPETDSYSLNDPHPPIIQKSEVRSFGSERGGGQRQRSVEKQPCQGSVLFTGYFFNAKQVWKLIGDGEITQVEVRSSKELAVTITLKKQTPRLEFQSVGTVKEPIEKCFVAIKEWK